MRIKAVNETTIYGNTSHSTPQHSSTFFNSTNSINTIKPTSPERGTRNIFFNRLAQRMPIPVLNLAGSLFYRHIG